MFGRVEESLAAAAVTDGMRVMRSEDRAMLMLPGSMATASSMAFLVRFGSGFVTAAVDAGTVDRHELTRMRGIAHGRGQLASVDAITGGTGISATDRAATVRALAAGTPVPGRLSSPGHLVPFAVDPAGVLGTPSIPEAAVDELVYRGLPPVAVLVDLVPDHPAIGLPSPHEVEQFAARFGLPVVTVGDVLTRRRNAETLVDLVSTDSWTLEEGTLAVRTYRARHGGQEFQVLHRPLQVAGAEHPVTVLAECTQAGRLSASRCRCADTLNRALRVTATGPGMLVVVRDPARTDSCAADGAQPAGEELAQVLTDVRGAVVSTTWVNGPLVAGASG